MFNFPIYFRAPLKTLVIHNGLRRSEICQEIFEILAEAKMRKYLGKDGTYGGAMKGLMKAQVASLDDTKIQEIADFIGK